MAAGSDLDSVLSLITYQQGGLRKLLRIVDRLGENFKQILQSVSSDKRLQLLQIKHSDYGLSFLLYEMAMSRIVLSFKDALD